ncbi:MAG: hypothetical protein JO265_08750 [Acidimicrobiia bacterium]|nr:hypothetical protein [Acidimicrobiia bacterium]
MAAGCPSAAAFARCLFGFYAEGHCAGRRRISEHDSHTYDNLRRRISEHDRRAATDLHDACSGTALCGV